MNGRRSWTVAALLALLLPLAQEAATQVVAPDSVRGDTLPRGAVAADTARQLPPDSVFERLRQLPGYTTTEYGGDSAAYDAGDKVLRLRGDPFLTRGTDRLTAKDSLVFRDRQQVVEAYGSPQVRGQGQEITGQYLFYDLGRRRATVERGRTRLTQGAQWIVVADITAPQSGDTLFGRNVELTTDDRPDPQYHFLVGRLQILKNQILVGRPAVLYFGDVPVFPLPFIFQRLEEGRASGILVPRFGINDIVRTSGRSRQISNVGYYWAINDYLGGQLATEWRSGSYTALQGGLDFRWTRQFLNGSFNFSRYWRDGGSTALNLGGNGNWKPDERTQINGSGNFASSSQFVRQESTDPLEVVQSLRSALSATRRFDWGSVNLGATRDQQVASGRVDATFPALAISVNPITFFREPLQERARWYNNVTLSGLAPSFTRSTVDLPDTVVADLDPTDPAFRRPPSDQERIVGSFSPNLQIGNLSIGSSLNLNRTSLGELPGGDEFDGLPTITRDEGSYTASVSYRQTLVASTSVSPTLQVSQQLLRNDTTGNEFVFGARRLSFGANLNTDLYRIYGGIGPYAAIRHHFKPTISYSYAPSVTQTPEQIDLFGLDQGQARNIVTVGMTNTFEAKLRQPDRPAADSLADTAAAAVPPPPGDAQKVTILALNTSAVQYDFVRAKDGNGFRTETLNNSVTSDYLRGLSLSFSHSLFEPVPAIPTLLRPEARPRRGRFSPFLSSLNASFSFGQESALIRWLGFGPRGSESATAEPGLVPNDSTDRTTAAAGGAGAATGNPREVGRGPWRASVQYALARPRGVAQALLPDDSGETQNLSGTFSFAPTPNWGVSWRTSYSLTTGDFAYHSLNLERDLYRWRANFSFYRTPTGNTSFEFSAQLIDLPELRIPFRERNIGAGG
ncbi:hypothetical protein BH23GEM4_BH23GEM4_17080 [soil metagenome]